MSASCEAVAALPRALPLEGRAADQCPAEDLQIIAQIENPATIKWKGSQQLETEEIKLQSNMPPAEDVADGSGSISRSPSIPLACPLPEGGS